VRPGVWQYISDGDRKLRQLDLHLIQQTDDRDQVTSSTGRLDLGAHTRHAPGADDHRAASQRMRLAFEGAAISPRECFPHGRYARRGGLFEHANQVTQRTPSGVGVQLAQLGNCVQRDRSILIMRLRGRARLWDGLYVSRALAAQQQALAGYCLQQTWMSWVVLELGAQTTRRYPQNVPGRQVLVPPHLPQERSRGHYFIRPGHKAVEQAKLSRRDVDVAAAPGHLMPHRVKH
jgi:hypothetical protein